MRAGINPGRRHLLRTVGAGLATGLAGCLGGGSSTPLPTPTADSVFEAVSIEDGTLVVDLREDHDVSRLNLIAPNGTLFESVDVAVGQTRARLQILEVSRESTSYFHYSPGVQTLVAVIGESTEELEIDLRPDPYITDIQQNRGGEGSDFANVIVSIENRGTAPTWVHDITFENAPNFTANDEISTKPGLLFVENADEIDDLILQTGEVHRYTDQSNPLLFREREERDCNITLQMTLQVVTVVNGVLSEEIRVNFGGEALTTNIPGEYTCNEIEIEQLTDSDDQTLIGWSGK